MKRTIWLLLVMAVGGRLSAQTTVNFNFSLGSQPVAGWINVSGDPSTAIRTATDPVTGITISSLSPFCWSPLSGSGSAYDGIGASGGTFFPAAVMLNHWFQAGAGGNYNTSLPQIQISGLHPDSLYNLRVAGSSTSSANTNPTQYRAGGTVGTPAENIFNHNNTANGAIFNNVQPDTAGRIWVYVNTLPTTDVADICGIQITASNPVISSVGQGLSVKKGVIALGDTTAGRGPHSFTSNRYQNLNGYMYSFGDTVNDPVTRPAFRIYGNGDLTAGTTMDRSVNTNDQIGLRYYAKTGYLQIGGSDRLDTTGSNIVYGHWPTSGLFINTDDSNSIHAKFLNGVFTGDVCKVDSGLWFENNYIGGEALHFGLPAVQVIRSYIGGYHSNITGTIDASVINGHIHTISKSLLGTAWFGFNNTTADTAWSSMVAGAGNQVGGLYQFTCGVGLVNRTPGGAALGGYSTDFSSLPYTGLKGLTAPNLTTYPLLTVGNGSGDGFGNASIRSNAVTVLFNGRTQINTTGHSTSLTQAQVTPQAALDVVSTNTGVLLPRLTNAQRGAIASGDLLNGLLLYNTDSSVFQYYNGSSWNSVGSGTGGSGLWQFSAGTVFDPTDNIGIGTNNTQGYKLAVNGTAIFTKIKVKDYSSWPDYVFDPGYARPALPELERYIREHRHLPGILSEQEVREKGIDVADQEAALLKKVEELTLYTIDQDKKLVDQAARLDAQQKEIDALKALIMKKLK